MIETNKYYNEKGGAKAIAEVGGALSAIIMGIGVNLSNRYRRHIAESFKDRVNTDGSLDRWDRLVLAVMPTKDRAFVYIGGKTRKVGDSETSSE